jgi:hypothetical protein
MLKASCSGKVGSQVNSHLGQLKSATLDRHPEIGSILEEHGFRQGEFADQFYSQLSSENMSALANKLLLTDHAQPFVYPDMIMGAHENQLGLQHELDIRENVSFDICFTDTKLLGLQFTQIYGQAHVYEIIPGSQADQLM